MFELHKILRVPLAVAWPIAYFMKEIGRERC